MISVVIPTLNAARTLPACLAALVPATVAGVVSEVIIADGGSTDETLHLADDAGCMIVASATHGRGIQLRAGAEAARKRWLLFLHADTVLEDGWHDEVTRFIIKNEGAVGPFQVAAFRFALDDASLSARVVEIGVALRCRLFRLPFGDQGLLIARETYVEAGGFQPVPLMEDVMLVRAISRRRRVFLRSKAVTSASRYAQDGYGRRVLRNWSCLLLFFAGVSIERIDRLYRGDPS